jgi:hypothetical protein
MIILKSNLTTDYTVTTSYADITMLKIVLPEDGYWFIYGSITAQTLDAGGTAAGTYIKLGLDGVNVPASGGVTYLLVDPHELNLYGPVPILYTNWLKKGTVITVRAFMDTGRNCIVRATTAAWATYIEAIKLG